MFLKILLLFITQMGDPTYLRTEEDHKLLNFYSKRYEQFVSQGEIPQTLHFIWIGGAALPSDAKKNIAKWAKLHPTWEIKLWSDRQRATPHPQVQVHLVKGLSRLEKAFAASDNEGERAALAAFEILEREGGVYLDCDTTPKKSLKNLNATHTFYTGLAPLSTSLLPSSVQVSPHIIAAAPHHPILQKTLSNIEKSWNPSQFEGQSFDAVYYRTKHHTLLPFQEAIQESLGPHDRVYPAETFTKKMVLHEEKKLWLPDEERFAKNILQKLLLQEKHLKWLLTLLSIFICIQFTQLINNGRKQAN